MFKKDTRARGAADSFDTRPTGDSCKADGLCTHGDMEFKSHRKNVEPARLWRTLCSHPKPDALAYGRKQPVTPPLQAADNEGQRDTGRAAHRNRCPWPRRGGGNPRRRTGYRRDPGGCRRCGGCRFGAERPNLYYYFGFQL